MEEEDVGQAQNPTPPVFLDPGTPDTNTLKPAMLAPDVSAPITLPPPVAAHR